jgi:flagellar hook-length control protein FliK
MDAPLTARPLPFGASDFAPPGRTPRPDRADGATADGFTLLVSLDGDTVDEVTTAAGSDAADGLVDIPGPPTRRSILQVVEMPPLPDLDTDPDASPQPGDSFEIMEVALPDTPKGAWALGDAGDAELGATLRPPLGSRADGAALPTDPGPAAPGRTQAVGSGPFSPSADAGKIKATSATLHDTAEGALDPGPRDDHPSGARSIDAGRSPVRAMGPSPVVDTLKQKPAMPSTPAGPPMTEAARRGDSAARPDAPAPAVGAKQTNAASAVRPPGIPAPQTVPVPGDPGPAAARSDRPETASAEDRPAAARPAPYMPTVFAAVPPGPPLTPSGLAGDPAKARGFDHPIRPQPRVDGPTPPVQDGKPPVTAQPVQQGIVPAAGQSTAADTWPPMPRPADTLPRGREGGLGDLSPPDSALPDTPRGQRATSPAIPQPMVPVAPAHAEPAPNVRNKGPDMRLTPEAVERLGPAGATSPAAAPRAAPPSVGMNKTDAPVSPPQAADSGPKPGMDPVLSAGGTTQGSATGALVVAASSPPPTGAPMTQHIAQHIAAQVPKPIGDMGSGTLELALDPPELGRVRMSLVDMGGALTLSILADRPETADLMRRHMDILAQEFSRAGLDAPNVRVGTGGDGSGAAPDRQAAPSPEPQDATPLAGTVSDRSHPPPDPFRALDLRL